MNQTTIDVSGMACEGCESNVVSALDALEGVTSATADHESGAVDVEYDPSAVDEGSIASAIEDAGYEVLFEPTPGQQGDD